MDKDKVMEIADELVGEMCENGEIDYCDLSQEKQQEIWEKAEEEYNNREVGRAESLVDDIVDELC